VFRRKSAPLSTLLGVFALAVAAAAGWAVAGYTAPAEGGLLPTVSVPTLPVSVPTLPVSVPTVSLPLGGTTTATATTTVTQTTTAAATVTSPLDSSTTTAADPAPAQTSTTGADPPSAVVAGVVRLANGQISVPVSSVAGHVRLVVTKVSLTPGTIRTKRARLALVLRVRDSRGYLVRGADLQLTSKPLFALAGTSERRTGMTGLVRFTFETTTRVALKAHTAVTIVARAHGAGTAAATRLVRVPVQPRRTPARPSKR
jgi:hypothetical protein